MARLPTPGGDDGRWGEILNQYLKVVHNDDGTLKDASITPSKLDTTIKTSLSSADSSVQLSTIIAKGDLITGAGSQSVNTLSIGNNGQVLTVDSTATSGLKWSDTSSSQYPNSSGLATTVARPFVIDIRDYGAKGDGLADDTASIQSAIDSSPTGSTILFPSGTYLISSSITLKGSRSYQGTGWSHGGGSVIKQKNAANIANSAGNSGLLVAEGWSVNRTSCDYPLSINNLSLDGNRANNPLSNACGIILCNFWSHIVDCYIEEMPNHGILLTDTTENGVNVITNSASENFITRCRIDNVSASGIRQISANTISNQDGFCVDTIIHGVGEHGIHYERGAGWVFRRNHIYGIQKDGIKLANCYATIITENEIEDFGREAASGAYYAGISIQQLNGRGSHITTNFIGCTEPSPSVGNYHYISAAAGASQTSSIINVTNNILRGPDTPTSKGIGLVYMPRSGGVQHMRSSDNHISNINTTSYIASQVVVHEADSRQIQHPIIGATTSRYAGPARGTGAPNVSGSGNDLAGTFSFGTGTSPTAGILGGITFEKNYGSTPIVILTPSNAATATLGLYVSAGNSNFDIGCSNAPNASQPAGTYVVNYIVKG